MKYLFLLILTTSSLQAQTYKMFINGFNNEAIQVSISYNEQGFDKSGLHEDTGTNFNEQGYDTNGYDINGFNEAGYDLEGFDINGYDLAGYHKDTSTLYDLDGFNKAGLTVRSCAFNSSNYIEYIYTASNAQLGLNFRYIIVYWQGARRYNAGYNDLQTAASIETSWNNRTLGQNIDVANGIYEQTNQSQSTSSDSNNVLSPAHDFQYGERRGICATLKR